LHLEVPAGLLLIDCAGPDRPVTVTDVRNWLTHVLRVGGNCPFGTLTMDEPVEHGPVAATGPTREQP
jgi:hypothetical protein